MYLILSSPVAALSLSPTSSYNSNYNDTYKKLSPNAKISDFSTSCLILFLLHFLKASKSNGEQYIGVPTFVCCIYNIYELLNVL